MAKMTPKKEFQRFCAFICFFGMHGTVSLENINVGMRIKPYEAPKVIEGGKLGNGEGT